MTAILKKKEPTIRFFFKNTSMIITFIWLIYMKEIAFKWTMHANFINKDIKKNNIKKYEEDKRVFKNWEILRWSKKG